MSDTLPDAAAVSTGRRGRIVKRLPAGAAILVQVGLLYYFVVMGIRWGSLGSVANLAQGLVILVVAVLLIRKHPLLVLPLPVLSFLLMLALQAVGLPLGPTKCTPPELSAAAELPPPPGSPPPSFESYPHGGCTADFYSSLSGKQILDHYRLAARDAGWHVEEPDPGEVVEAPGKEPPTLAEREVRTLLSNDRVTAEVTWEPVEEGPMRGQTFVIVHLYERNE
jgi:hypothetical protein